MSKPTRIPFEPRGSLRHGVPDEVITNWWLNIWNQEDLDSAISHCREEFEKGVAEGHKVFISVKRIRER